MLRLPISEANWSGYTETQRPCWFIVLIKAATDHFGPRPRRGRRGGDIEAALRQRADEATRAEWELVRGTGEFKEYVERAA